MVMKVLNLQCAQQHSFEGWFASEVDFQSQLSGQMIECPMCESNHIEKMPSAPRLNFGAQQQHPFPSVDSALQTPASSATLRSGEMAPVAGSHAEIETSLVTGGQADFLKALRHLVANTENVGRRFADEARRMHYGELEPRSIRGQASAREAVELLEEGIEVMPLPLPAAFKETLQ